MKTSWKSVKLADVVEVASGQVDPTEPPYCDMPHVGGDNIVSNTGMLFGLKTARELNLISGKYSFDENDVLYSKIRPALNKVVAPDFKGICSADIYPIRPLNGKLCREYLVYLLRSKDFYDYAAKHSSRTNIPKINRVALLAFETCLPPVSEQHRIAAILDKADAIRRKREEGIRLTEDLLRSAFLQMFGDPATNSKKWNMVKMSEALAADRPGMRCGPFGSALHKEEYVTEGVPVWGIENVRPNQFEEAGSLFITEDKYLELAGYSVSPGDVLISRAGTVGRMCVARPQHPRSIIGTNLIRVALNQAVLSPDYFTALFTYFADRVAGLRASSDDGAYSFMQTGVLKEVRVPLPPIQMQEVYATCVATVRKNQETRQAAASDADRLFGSLVQRAFRGEL